MNLRFSMPRVRGRGAGIGNEIIPWARSFIAAQVLGAIPLPPAFGFNTRKYWRHFGTPRYDWVLHRAMEHVLPVIEFNESEYIKFGGGEFIDSLKRFSEAKGLDRKSKFLITTEGMWGGYDNLLPAKDFIRSTLYKSNFAAKNLLKIEGIIPAKKILVALHVRLGDFSPAINDIQNYRGMFNCSLPLDWYINVASSIYKKLGDNVQFLIVTDGSLEEIQPLLERFPCITTVNIPDSDCSDLLLLSKADLLVCSVSSYSLLAAFLSDAPYIWFEPNLQKHQEGFYSIWGNRSNQSNDQSYTKRAINYHLSNDDLCHRGLPVGIDGKVTEELIMELLAIKNKKNRFGDLIFEGVVPF